MFVCRCDHSEICIVLCSHLQQQHDHREATIIYVPNEHVGRVIGRKGAHIKELQGQSGAKIYLPGETSSDMPFRRMRIHGTPEQRHRCYQLLLQKVPYLEQAPIELINTNGAYAPQGIWCYSQDHLQSRENLT